MNTHKTDYLIESINAIMNKPQPSPLDTKIR